MGVFENVQFLRKSKKNYFFKKKVKKSMFCFFPPKNFYAFESKFSMHKKKEKQGFKNLTFF